MRCYRCQNPNLTADDFSKGNNRCRSCHKIYQAERRALLATTNQPDMTGTKVCSTCAIPKAKTEFGFDKGVKDGFQPQCNDCRSKSRKKYNTTRKGHIQNMVVGARQRAKQRGRDFAITTADVEQLWEAQQGLCALSGRPFVTTNDTGANRDPYGPSIDRVSCDLGYVAGNLRLTTTLMNLAIGTWGEEVMRTIAIAVMKKQGYLVKVPPVAVT